MKPQTKTLLSTAIVLALIALLIYYIKANISEFAQLKITNPLFLIILIIIFVFNYFLIGIVNKSLLSALKVKLSIFEAFSLSIITGFYNLITPFRGGAAARAVYLKKKHNFAYVHFLATLSAIYVLVFLVASLLGIISTILLYLKTGIFSWLIFLIFDAMFLGMLFITMTSPKLHNAKNKWLNRFVKVINGWHLIKNDRKVIFTTILITLIQILLSSLMLYFQFRVFGIDVSFLSALFLSSIGALSIVIGLTPGNFGVNEAIIVFSAATIGITPAESLSAALLGRAVSLVVLFILGPLFSYTLIRKKTKKSTPAIN